VIYPGGRKFERRLQTPHYNPATERRQNKPGSCVKKFAPR
jgi:hypothetical protein